MDMSPLIKAVYLKMEKLFKESNLMLADVSKDKIWETYLESIPAEHNPIFLVNRAFDCNLCKQFIRRAGRIQHITNDLTIDTIWNVTVADPVLQELTNTLHELVSTAKISTIYVVSPDVLTKMNCIGVADNIRIMDDESTIKFEHFHSPSLPNTYITSTAGDRVGSYNSTFSVFKRALEELPIHVLEEVLDLINDDNLYQGAQWKQPITEFIKHKRLYDRDDEHIDIGTRYVHKAMSSKLLPTVTNLRNTSIGTMLVDMSEGTPLEEAVRKYEAITAPTNYKRSKSVVTEKMVTDAKTKIESLGLMSAFDRRHARLDDIGVANLLFVDRNQSKPVNDDMFSGIATAANNTKSDKYEDITVRDFMNNVLPGATKVEVCPTRAHAANTFNLTTTVDEGAPKLFKWDNGFAWNYKGNVTSRIRERVKAAGGIVDAPICVRLAWNYSDDLDLHLVCSKFRCYFGNERIGGWELDVDANAHSVVDNPVENIFARIIPASDQMYSIEVHNYNRRSSEGNGFEMEIVINGETTHVHYTKPLSEKEAVVVGTIIVTNGNAKILLSDKVTMDTAAYESNGITFGKFSPVSAISLSPNQWNGESGNPHFFFYMDGYRTDEEIRSFYNEFLRPELHENRKVFEILGGKQRLSPDGPQLGGLGFTFGSEGNKDKLLVRTTHGDKMRTFNVTF